MTAIVFDLDGTLIDSAPDIQEAANRMLAEEGRGPLDLATVTSFVGNGLAHLVDLVIRYCDLPAERHQALTGRVLVHYKAVNGAGTRVYPGVAAALDALAGAGHRMAICTNKLEGPARHVLESLGLIGHFESVIGGDTLPRRKPDPAPLLASFAALGADGGLFVGDSEVDAETAQRSAVPFLLYTEGYRKTPVDQIENAANFGDFADLPALVARMTQGAAAGT